MLIFLLPAVVATAIALTHAILGGRDTASPLLASQELPREVMLTHYYCWHMVTIVLFSLAAAYLMAALLPWARALALFATGLSALFALWGLGLVLWKSQRHAQMPQWILFLALTGTGVWALVGS
jgi:hypothetical protein